MMSFFAPLDDVLGSTSKVRVLRLLVEQDRTVSAREAARLTGMSLPPVLAAIDELTALGLISREESGNQFLCKANRDHQLYKIALKELFAAEATWAGIVVSAIRQVLTSTAHGHSALAPDGGDVLVAWIFGSVAKGKDLPDSDLDLFAITTDEVAAETTKDKLTEALAAWRREFGLDVRPIVMSRTRAASDWRNGNQLLTNALKDPRIILGEIPEELQHG